MIDFHCHLDLYPNPRDVVKECTARRLYVLTVTTTPSAWKGTSSLVGKAERIRVALGLHPELARERKSEVELFKSLLPECRYVGEIGLDGSPEFKGHWGDQIEVFESILAACKSAGGRIMTIHSRRAAKDVLDRLEAFRGAGVPVLHWYSGNRNDLARAVALGCWFSVGPAMLGGEKGRALVNEMPRDRLLTETDGPFATVGGRSVFPWDVGVAVDALAKLWDTSNEQAQKVLRDNLRQLMKLV
jgi:TatD DNase family protein